MFCVHCGNRLRNGDQFCNKCGMAVLSLEKKMSNHTEVREDHIQKVQDYSYQKQEEGINQSTPYVQPRYYYSENAANNNSSHTVLLHPYHKLGGWLLAVVIFFYCVAGALLIYSLSELIRGFIYLSSFFVTKSNHEFYVFWFFKIQLFSGSITLGAIAAILFANKVIKRNETCLGFLQIASMVSVSVYIGVRLIIILWNEFLDPINRVYCGFRTAEVLILIILFCSVLLVSFYFGKSVRVRTYMGSDKYLRKSVFNRKMPSPIPADGSL